MFSCLNAFYKLMRVVVASKLSCSFTITTSKYDIDTLFFFRALLITHEIQPKDKARHDQSITIELVEIPKQALFRLAHFVS